MFLDHTRLLKKAQKEGFAVPAFNVNNMEFIQAIVETAIKMNSPVIIQTSEGAVEYAGIDYLFALAQIASNQKNALVSLHLDHGKNVETIKQAIDMGYSSVMFDGSSLPFNENVRITKEIVAYAHQRHVQVEAELGELKGVEDFVEAKKSVFTDPHQAKEFVEATGCDSLAISIGTSHGAFKFTGRTNLDYKRLEDIRSRIKIPLVLHGASGIPDNIVQLAQRYGANLAEADGVSDYAIKKAISKGICKVNIDSDLRIAFDAGIREYLSKNPKDIDPRHILGNAKDVIAKLVSHKITIMGSEGRG